MQTTFTLHSIAWEAGASLLLDVRVAACASGLLSPQEIGSDELDEKCRHALVLSKGGRAIGCARITPEGRIERVAVMPHEQRDRIVVALIDTLKDYASHAGLVNVQISDSSSSRI